MPRLREALCRLLDGAPLGVTLTVLMIANKLVFVNA